MLGPLLAVTLLATPTGEITLDAERVLHDGQKDLTTAEGNARLVTEGAAIDADRIVYSRRDSAATATGHVVMRVTQGGLVAVTADVVTVRFDGEEVREIFLLDGRAVSKRGVTAERLLAAHTAEEVRAAGTTVTLLTGNHLTRDGPRWTVEDIELVPCECNFDQPSWSVRASTAIVDTEADRVTAWWPRVTVHSVPVLWFPWISLPLTSRQTGLLFPRPTGTLQSGFGLDLPVFITLGRSADLTLTPGFFTGGDGAFGVQGPRLGAELRYVPSTRARGQATVSLLYDLRPGRDPVDAALSTGSPRGLRWIASLNHSQDLGGGFGARVDAVAHSDGYSLRDFVTDVLAREAGYVRSTASAFQRGDDHLLWLDVTLRQDLGWGYSLLRRTPRYPAISGAPAVAPRTLQRLPALGLKLPARQLVGPIFFELEAEVARIAPLFGGTGDEGAAANEGRAFDATGAELPTPCLQQRLYFPFRPEPAVFSTFYLPSGLVRVPSHTALLDPLCVMAADKAGQGDGVWQAGEREARDRVMVMPRLWAAIQPGGALSLSASAAWRQGVWLGELTGRSSQRGYPVLGARAETQLARTFAGGTLRHSVIPSVEVRGVPFVVGSSPAPYDEVDLAIPSAGSWAQAALELRQRLARRGGPDAAWLDVGQGVALVEPGLSTVRLGESYARLGGAVGWLSGSGTARFDPVQLRPTRISATFAFDDGRGHGVGATWENFLDDGSDRSRAPMDLLFGSPVPPSATSRGQLISAGAQYRLGAVTVHYQALFLNRLYVLEDRTTVVAVPALAQHTLGVGWAPACDCWGVEVYATHRPAGANWLVPPDLGATLTVSRFGSIAVGR